MPWGEGGSTLSGGCPVGRFLGTTPWCYNADSGLHSRQMSNEWVTERAETMKTPQRAGRPVTDQHIGLIAIRGLQSRPNTHQLEPWGFPQPCAFGLRKTTREAMGAE